MPKRIFIILTTVTILSTVTAQGQWARMYGLDGSDRGYAMEVIPQGYMVTGRTTSFSEHSFEDMFLLKVEPSGDTAWWKPYVVDERDERAYSIDVCSDGGYVIAGYAEIADTTDADFYLVKTDPSGEIEWMQSYGGDGQDTAYSVIQTPDGGYLVAGFSTSFIDGGSSAYIVRTDEVGDTLWTRLYVSTLSSGASCIIPAHDEGYVIAGWQSPGNNNEDLYVLKIADDGSTVWEQSYGGEFDDKGYWIEVTTDGGYIVSGTTWSFTSGRNDVWLLKLDSAGDTVWSRSYGGAENEEGFCVRQTSDGGYVIMAYTESEGAGEEDCYLIKTDGAGEVLWDRLYGGDKMDMCYQVQQTADGGYFMAGRTRSFGAVRCDYYLIKTDAQGMVGLAEHPPQPSFDLSVSPGPLIEQATVTYHLPRASSVELSVFDVSGRRRVTLYEGVKGPGTHHLTWNGADDGGYRLPFGVYFLRLETPGINRTARFVILK